MRTHGTVRSLKLLGMAAALSALAGCMQLDTRVHVNEDGSATITEKLRFSRRLLDLGDAKGEGGSEVASLLSKDAALERMKHMGDGMTLTSHEIKEVEGGARESIAVFQIPDLNNFKYVSPWLAYTDYPENNVIQAKLYPLYKSNPYANGKAGEMAISFKYLKNPKGEAPLPKDQPPPPGPSPSELQVYRELGPVFKDMLRDFKVRFTLEAYAPILRSGLGVRGQSAGSKEIDLINFTDRDLDNFGSSILDNEEVMLDLVRMDVGSEDICNNVKNFVSNTTLPVFMPHGSKHMWWTGGSEIPFKPSKPLFDKHFAGKKLDYSEWQAQPPEKHVDAVFEKIGWKGGQ